MFITVYSYRAREGHAQTTIRLHLELGRNPAWRGPGFLCGELLQSLENPSEFVEIARFESEQAAREVVRRREFTAWHARLLETLDLGPSYSHFHIVVQSHAAVLCERQHGGEDG
jgi:heme-degrading monooxygenase HmoA